MTLKQLKYFIDRRNCSELATNLQFANDGSTAGIDVYKDLGKAMKTEYGYRWQTSHGELREDRRFGSGKLALFVDGKFAYGDSRVSTP